jgi:hypothetical protein
MENGVYSRSSPAPAPKKPADAPAVPGGAPVIPAGVRPPNVCRPWAEESAAYKHLSGDAGLVRSQWEKADAAAYNYLWTTVLW